MGCLGNIISTFTEDKVKYLNRKDLKEIYTVEFSIISDNLALRPRRELIIDVMSLLFHAEGFNAAWLKMFKDSDDVTKKTLHNQLRSKNVFILAMFRREDKNIRTMLIGVCSGRGRNTTLRNFYTKSRP